MGIRKNDVRQWARNEKASRSGSFVDLAPVRDPGHADLFPRVVNDVHHATIADPDAPLVLAVFQLFAARGPGIVGQGFQLADDSRQNAIR